MFCQNCGKPIEDSSKFCLHCGTQVGAALPGTPPVQPMYQAAYQPAYAPAMNLYAGFWKRFAALLIDTLITGIFGFVIGLVIGFVGAATHMDMKMLQPISMLAGFIIGLLYFVMMESSEKQATFGKMALGIKVTDMHGERLTFLRALGRYFAKFLSSLTLCIGYMMAGFTSRKQALHDMVANTLVVNRDADPEQLQNAPMLPQSGMSAGAIVAIVLGVSIIPVIGILAAIAIPAYQDYTVRAKMAGAVAYGHTATLAVEEYYRSHNAVPASLEEAGVSSPNNPSVRDAYINPTNGIITLSMNFKPIEGEKLMFVPDEDSNGKITWTCRSDDIKEKYLPKECR